MALNLIRNARMFFTTNISSTGIVQASGFTNANTFEIQVLDGLSFSQNTTTETITVNEAGDSPIRGQRQFNTALDPAEITFSTYIRPYKLNETGALPAWSASFARVDPSGANATLGNGTGGTQIATAYGPNTFIYADAAPAGGRTARFSPVFNSSSQLIGITMVDAGAGYLVLPTVYIVDPDTTAETGADLVQITLSGSLTTGANIVPEEYVLWEAFATGLGATSGWVPGSSFSEVNFNSSSKNQLTRFGMIIVLDGTSYFIDNCSLDQASIDFGLDAISTIAWTARGTELRSASTNIAINDSTNSLSGGASGNFKPKITSAHFLANKLSTVSIQSITRGGQTVSGATKTYTLALTGGNITLANNITYLTPANLGIVNKPVTYFTGTRAISGSFNCYLKTGSNNSYGLMQDMLAQSTTNVQPSFDVELHIGGKTGDPIRLQIDLDSCVFSIPTINTEQVVSQTLNFTAQGSTGGDYDLAATNEAVIKYYSI